MNAIIYARFSPRPNAAESDSIETQNDRCEAYCASKGLALLSKHEDRELSGKSAHNRPGLQAAIAAACDNKAVLVIYSLSRLARSTTDALSIAERLDKAGANIASLHENIDTSCAMGRFTFTIFAALAALEREVIAERTSDAMLRHQGIGRRMSWRAPFGWSDNGGDKSMLEVNEPEQRIIWLIRSKHKEGMGLREICRFLGESGITCRGGKWYHATVGNILRRS